MTRFLLVAGLAAVAAGPVFAQPARLDRLHADLLFTPGSGPTASGGWAAPQVRINNPDTTRPAADTVLVVNNSATTVIPRPAGSQFDFVGASAGDPIWLLRQSNNQANQVYLGIRSEGSGFTAWDPGNDVGSAPWLELTARKRSGPGQFAVWQTGSFGEVNPFVSTSNPSATLFDNKLYTVANGHDHFNFAFTQAGTYEIEFDVKANLAGGFLLSDPSKPLVFTFEVQPVPEPAGILAAVAAGAAAVRGVRRRRAGRA